MADTPTLDDDIVIESASVDPPVTVYRRVSTGARWRVSGACNQCGLCVVGAVGDWYVWDGPAGTPNANRDTRWPNRLDDPIVPELLADMVEMAQQTPTAIVTGCSTFAEYV